MFLFIILSRLSDSSSILPVIIHWGVSPTPCLMTPTNKINIILMSTEVSASETATELVLPTVHPEVTELVHKPEDIWKRRRVLIRDIICTRNFSFLFSSHD